MNSWKIILWQSEAGYALYRAALIWQGSRPCKFTEAQPGPYGYGIYPAEAVCHTAEESLKIIKQVLKDIPDHLT